MKKIIFFTLVATSAFFASASYTPAHAQEDPPSTSGDASINFCNDATSSDARHCTLAERITDEKGYVYRSWVVTRGVVNIVLIIGLLLISFSNISHGFLGLNLESYTIKKALPSLLLGIILANASLFIIRWLADLSTVFVYFFVERAGFGDNFPAFLSAVVGNIGLKTLDSIGVIATNPVVSSILLIVVGIIALIGILWLAFILYGRLVIIYLLTILSPLAFIANGIPGLEKYFKQWWQQFIKWTFMLVAMSAIFWIILVVADPKSTEVSITQIVTMYILLFFALSLPSKLGGAIVDKATNLFKNNPVSNTAKDYGKIAAYNTPMLGTALKLGEYSKKAREARLKIAEARAGARAATNPLARGYHRAVKNLGEAEGALEGAEAKGETDALDEGKFATFLHRVLKTDPLSVRLIRSEFEKNEAIATRDAKLAQAKLEFLADKKNAEMLDRVFDKVNDSSVLSGEAGKQEGIKKGNLAREELILSKNVEDFRKAEKLEEDQRNGVVLTPDQLAHVAKKGQFKAEYDRLMASENGKFKDRHSYYGDLSIEEAAKDDDISKAVSGARRSQSAKAVNTGVKATIEEALKEETLDEANESYFGIDDAVKQQLVKGDTRGINMKDQHVFVSHTQKLVSWARNQNDHRRDGSLAQLARMVVESNKGPVKFGTTTYSATNIDDLEDALKSAVGGQSNNHKRQLLREIADKHPFIVGSGSYQAGHFD